MRVLIIGASGQVGNGLYQSHLKDEDETIGTYCTVAANQQLIQLDITNYQAVADFITKFNPELVYLPAATASVDWCELYPHESFKINVVGVKHVAKALSKTNHQAKLVYFSTDYVFDGIEGVYDESSIPYPINEYGKQKLLAEHIVLSDYKNSLIVRTNVVFGPDPQNKNFVSAVINKLQNKESVSAVVDEWGTPTFGPDLTRITRQAVKSDLTNILHIGGATVCNRYKLALKVAEVFELDRTLIKPIASSALARPAPRPLHAGLSSRRGLGPARDIEQALYELKKEIVNLF